MYQIIWIHLLYLFTYLSVFHRNLPDNFLLCDKGLPDYCGT